MIDVAAMARERHARLQAQLVERDLAAAVLLHGPNVSYATGLVPSGADATHASFRRDVAIVVAGAPRPHLFTDRPAVTADVRLPVEVHDPLWPELDEGAESLGSALSDLVGGDGRVAVDEMTGAMLRAGVPPGNRPADAGRLVGGSKLVKSDEELACIDQAQRHTEKAMEAARRALRAGAHRRHLVAAFQAALAEQGAGPNMIDPIFQPMPSSIAEGPRTTTGHVAFPVAQRDWSYTEGDVVWVDAGVDHLGFSSDFGDTWMVGDDGPTPELQACRARWWEVTAACEEAIRPGVSLGDVGRGAIEVNGGQVPWLPHFYLAHGLGIESAEMPMIGTDLGPDFDDGFILEEGMVLVLEPVIWHEGHHGFRAELVVCLTADGCRRLGDGPSRASDGHSKVSVR